MIKHLTKPIRAIHFLVLALLMTLSTPVKALSFIFDSGVTGQDLKSIKSVYVSLNDDVVGGCWTNLKEVREYAEEKLRIKGIKTTDDATYTSAEDKTYYLSIAVSGGRLYKNGTGPCVSSLSVYLEGWTKINGQLHLALLGRFAGNLADAENHNQNIIILMDRAFDSFPR
ncbi:hypothetical protein N8159_02620 [Planktomarina temperata]|nr:hypothetical protein [Planktomarina temperata]